MSFFVFVKKSYICNEVKRLIAILFLTVFMSVLMSPVAPFVYAYVYHHFIEKQPQIYIKANCREQKIHTDPYLEALLKRVCKQKKKEAPKVPVSLFQTLFVKNLISHTVSSYAVELCLSITISDFVPEVPYDAYIPGLFRPPSIKV